METGDAKLVSIRTMDIAVAHCPACRRRHRHDGQRPAGSRLARNRRARRPDTSRSTSACSWLLRASSICCARCGSTARAVAASSLREPAFRRVLAVLLPFAVYVFAISFIGIYVASAIYIALFMW